MNSGEKFRNSIYSVSISVQNSTTIRNDDSLQFILFMLLDSSWSNCGWCYFNGKNAITYIPYTCCNIPKSRSLLTTCFMSVSNLQVSRLQHSIIIFQIEMLVPTVLLVFHGHKALEDSRKSVMKHMESHVNDRNRLNDNNFENVFQHFEKCKN